MGVIIYHNPNCGTSRNTLAMIRNAGIEPEVIEYLKTPPTRDELSALVTRMGIHLRAALRRKGTPFDELGLGNPALDDGVLLDVVERHPVLINRPIVVTPRGVKLCRPSEVVLELLDEPQRTAFVKEDGEPVVTASVLAPDELDELAGVLSAAGLPTEDIAGPGRRFYRVTNTIGETVAFGGLEGDGVDRLLRSLAVLASSRGKGFGKAALAMLERLAETEGVKRLHVLTTTAAPFFQRLGFKPAGRHEAPAAIAATTEFTGLCPASARYLTKDLRLGW